ncbi:MAG: SAM-dependent chlorinase/fluorinase [Hormoscilla sp. GM7CHS1pb]|nr:SAM-dependent chlorinase/fluorinase [Hormoscilla sp. GM7CHS1pb]
MDDRHLLTLLSDFGLSDIYVGVMKGVIARINPSLKVVDITHNIPPQNILAARFCLREALPYFPAGTVHVAVVDPGVGSSRRAIALFLSHFYLVGPDNGIFSGILAENPVLAAVELDNPEYWHTPTPSSTFHGRDIFAPVGAHLASGVPLVELGNPIDPETLVQLPLPACTHTATSITGCIQYIDHFGNLITNIPGSCVRAKQWYIKLENQVIKGSNTYADSPPLEAIALVGSHGWVEIAVNGGNAQSQLQLDWKDQIEVNFHDISISKL